MTVQITYFVHGTTTDNEEGLATGWLPGELSSLGIKQSRELGKLVAKKRFDMVFCSDLKRAVDSAMRAFGNKYQIIQDKRLRECNYGDFNGKPEAFKESMEKYVTKRFPQGESYHDVELRISDFLRFLREKYQGKHIAIVAHQAPQLALDVLCKGKTWEQAIREDWRHTRSWKPGWEYLVEYLADDSRGITTILFDLDGTLIDEKIYAGIYPKVLRVLQEKTKLTLRQVEEKAQQKGLSKNKAGRFDSGELCRLFGATREYYQILKGQLHKKPVLNKKMFSLMKKLNQEGKKVGIVSNSRRKTILLYIQEYHLAPSIDFIFSSEDAGFKKNDKAFWKTLAKKKKLRPEGCLVIGDNPVEDREIPGSIGFQIEKHTKN